MDWEKFFLQLIIELGGISGIALIGLQYLGNTFADRLSKKYEFKLNEKFELYKNTIENRSYVSKTKFDASFSVCCEISENLVTCFDVIKRITPIEEQDIEAPIEVEMIESDIANLKRIISRNMPVIPMKLYEELYGVVEIFRNQVLAYKNLIADTENVEINFLSQKEMKEKEIEIYELFRQYYNNLEVTSDKR